MSPVALEPPARRFVECGAQDLPLLRRRRVPGPTAPDEAAACVNYRRLLRLEPRDQASHGQFGQRRVLAQERGAVQPPVRIESEHFVDESNDGAGCPIANLSDGLGHAHALPGEALESIALRVVDHPALNVGYRRCGDVPQEELLVMVQGEMLGDDGNRLLVHGIENLASALMEVVWLGKAGEWQARHCVGWAGSPGVLRRPETATRGLQGTLTTNRGPCAIDRSSDQSRSPVERS